MMKKDRKSVFETKESKTGKQNFRRQGYLTTVKHNYSVLSVLHLANPVQYFALDRVTGNMSIRDYKSMKP